MSLPRFHNKVSRPQFRPLNRTSLPYILFLPACPAVSLRGAMQCGRHRQRAVGLQDAGGQRPRSLHTSVRGRHLSRGSAAPSHSRAHAGDARGQRAGQSHHLETVPPSAPFINKHCFLLLYFTCCCCRCCCSCIECIEYEQCEV